MKNKTMRVAALLLALTLMTSCFVGGTFAKYTTSGDSFDQARVAKWGVVVTADFSKAFTRGYKEADTVSYETEAGASVWADAEVDVVAPGTSGELADFTVTGAPEVDVNVTYAATLTLENWFIDTNKNGTQDAGEAEYCPIIITVNTVDYYIGSNKYDSAEKISTVAELVAAVESAIEASSETYQANKNLADADGTKDDLAVSWKWLYEVGTGEELKANDAKDTALGNQAAATGDWINCKAATIKIEVECTVTQVD